MQNTLAILGVKADKPKGIFDQETGTIYLIRNNLNSVEALERTVFHEALGHKGLRLAFGKDFKNIMLDLFDLMGQKEFDRLAEKYGLSLPEYDAIHQIREYYAQRQMPHEKVILFMDELLANMAEVNKPSIQQKLKEFWGRFRVWLYDHGFIKLNNLGESELLAILRDARKAIKTAQAAIKMKPIFYLACQIMNLTHTWKQCGGILGRVMKCTATRCQNQKILKRCSLRLMPHSPFSLLFQMAMKRVRWVLNANGK